MMRRQSEDDDNEQSRALQDLSSLVLNILRDSRRRRSTVPQQITPAGFASLMLGISLTLMLCGSVTFFIGFLLLPWVVGLVMLFYLVGLLSGLSVLGRTLLYYATSPSPPSSPTTSPKHIPVSSRERASAIPGPEDHQ
ncbi:hypothetical protein KSS87_018729 [Heliosperma pusillum]|nr:hypothetical protein KSS87_018729 [Heliosperma pusillum]